MDAYLPERTIGSQSRAESEYCVYPYARLCDANNLVLLHLLRVPARFFRDYQPRFTLLFFPSPRIYLRHIRCIDDPHSEQSKQLDALRKFFSILSSLFIRNF